MPLESTSSSLLPLNSALASTPCTSRIDTHAENRMPYGSEPARTPLTNKKLRSNLPRGDGSPVGKSGKKGMTGPKYAMGKATGMRTEGSPARAVPASKVSSSNKLPIRSSVYNIGIPQNPFALPRHAFAQQTSAKSDCFEIPELLMQHTGDVGDASFLTTETGAMDDWLEDREVSVMLGNGSKTGGSPSEQDVRGEADFTTGILGFSAPAQKLDVFQGESADHIGQVGYVPHRIKAIETAHKTAEASDRPRDTKHRFPVLQGEFREADATVAHLEGTPTAPLAREDIDRPDRVHSIRGSAPPSLTAVEHISPPVPPCTLAGFAHTPHSLAKLERSVLTIERDAAWAQAREQAGIIVGLQEEVAWLKAQAKTQSMTWEEETEGARKEAEHVKAQLDRATADAAKRAQGLESTLKEEREARAKDSSGWEARTAELAIKLVTMASDIAGARADHSAEKATWSKQLSEERAARTATATKWKTRLVAEYSAHLRERTALQQKMRDLGAQLGELEMGKMSLEAKVRESVELCREAGMTNPVHWSNVNAITGDGKKRKHVHFEPDSHRQAAEGSARSHIDVTSVKRARNSGAQRAHRS